MHNRIKNLFIICFTLSCSFSFGQELSAPTLSHTTETGEQVYTTNGYVSSTSKPSIENERKAKSIEDFTLGELEDLVIQLEEKINMLKFQAKFHEIKSYHDQKVIVENRILFIKENNNR